MRLSTLPPCPACSTQSLTSISLNICHLIVVWALWHFSGFLAVQVRCYPWFICRNIISTSAAPEFYNLSPNTGLHWGSWLCRVQNLINVYFLDYINLEFQQHFSFSLCISSKIFTSHHQLSPWLNPQPHSSPRSHQWKYFHLPSLSCIFIQSIELTLLPEANVPFLFRFSVSLLPDSQVLN